MISGLGMRKSKIFTKQKLVNLTRERVATGASQKVPKDRSTKLGSFKFRGEDLDS